MKSLLVAALVPEVGPLRALTVSRLTALNSGIVRAYVPGTERQQVLDKLRRWAAEVGELRGRAALIGNLAEARTVTARATWEPGSSS